jgi:hypothetical protein
MLLPATARADDKAECLAAHEDGQVARRGGRFDRAREDFAVCQRDVCPAVLRARCADYARELEAVQPSIVVMARDAQGAAVGEARVTLDGAPPVGVAALALGRRLNPGVHTLRVEAPGFFPADKTITLPEGVKNMQVIVSLESPKSAAPPARAEIVSTPKPIKSSSKGAAWGFAIGSGVSLLAAGALSGVGWGIHTSLNSSCGNMCMDSQVEPLRVLWPASFAALGVGVATGIVAAILFAQHPAERNASAFVIGPAGAGVSFQ